MIKIFYILITFIAAITITCCDYILKDRVVILTSKERDWISNPYYNYPFATFKSDSDIISKLVIVKSTTYFHPDRLTLEDSVIKENKSNKDLDYAFYEYCVIEDSGIIDGYFIIKNEKNEDSLLFNITFGAMESVGRNKEDMYRPIEMTKFRIGNRVIDSCIVLSTSNSSMSIMKNVPKIGSKEEFDSCVYAWKYGLIFYKKSNGERFFRVFDSEMEEQHIML